MAQRTLAIVVLFVFIAVAVFGLTSLLGHSDHHHNCPLQGATAVLCESSTIEHIGIWQGMFVAILLLLALVVGAPFFLERVKTALSASVAHLRPTYTMIPRPTLLQELFSAGILNRKEPYAI